MLKSFSRNMTALVLSAVLRSACRPVGMAQLISAVASPTPTLAPSSTAIVAIKVGTPAPL